MIRALTIRQPGFSLKQGPNYHEPLLDVGVRKPFLHGQAADNVVNSSAAITRSGIDFLFPAGKHPFPIWMKCSADVPEDRTLSTGVSLPKDLSPFQQLIEEATSRCRDKLQVIQPLFSH